MSDKLVFSEELCMSMGDTVVISRSALIRMMKAYATTVAQQALNDAASRVRYKRGSMEIDTDSIINTPIKTP